MKRIALLIATLFYLLIPATAFAWSPLDQACTANKSSSACSSSSSNPIYGSGSTLEKVTILFSIISGIAAVIIIIVAGFRMITSNGDSQSVAGARSAIIGALVGLVIILTAASIITFVVHKI